MRYLTGFHAIEESIKSGKATGPLLVGKAGPRARAIMTLASENKIRIDRVGEHELNRISHDHRGIALAVEGVSLSAETGIEEFLAGLEADQDALVVILDGITDPHNFGAIMRSCDQFGVNLLVSATKRSAKDSDTVAKTSAGASAWLPHAVVPNLVRAVQQLKDEGFWVYGADMNGDLVFNKDLRGRTALIMGSEGNGISRLLREKCDACLAVPSKGKVDSLNVSVAAGVILYEALRQRS